MEAHHIFDSSSNYMVGNPPRHQDDRTFEGPDDWEMSPSQAGLAALRKGNYAFLPAGAAVLAAQPDTWLWQPELFYSDVIR